MALSPTLDDFDPSTKATLPPNIEFQDYCDESQLGHVMKLVTADLSEPYSSKYFIQSTVHVHSPKALLAAEKLNIVFCNLSSSPSSLSIYIFFSIVFTYRYFVHRFPELCILAVPKNGGEPIGCVVGKIDQEESTNSSTTTMAQPPFPSSTSTTTSSVLQQSQQQQQQQSNSVHVANGGTNNNTSGSDNIQPKTTADIDPQSPKSGYIGMLAVQSSYRRQGIGKALVEQVLRRMKAMGCQSVALETEVSNTSAQRLYQESFGFIREELLVRYYLNYNDAYRLRLWFQEGEEEGEENYIHQEPEQQQ